MNLLAEKIKADINHNKYLELDTMRDYKVTEEIELFELDQRLTPLQIKELTKEFFNEHLYNVHVKIKGVNGSVIITASGTFNLSNLLENETEFTNDLNFKFDIFINTTLIN